MQNQYEKLKADAFRAIDGASSLEDLRSCEVTYLGKKGTLTELLKNLKSVPPEERPKLGQLINEIKTLISEKIKTKQRSLETASIETASEEWLDVTLVPAWRTTQVGTDFTGTIHPLSKLQHDIETICIAMGFLIMDGPHVETEINNFDALNIPSHHPARDIQDTIWCKGWWKGPTIEGHLLRTHTSPVQIRAMTKFPPPLRVIAPGRVFRYEATDASHENTFTQVEGFMIDANISIAHLIYTMQTLIRAILSDTVSIRLRPGYFPFVEPGFELDISCLFCDKTGCRICKHTGWLEFLGCGLVHPNVLKFCNINPDTFSGFAFGFGLERLAMLKYRIDDIRYFLSGDLRFLKQFGKSSPIKGISIK